MVFSLNTIMGFACSLGVDMGYNSKHHAHEKSDHIKPHDHHSAHKHQHTDVVRSGTTIKALNNDCCTNAVTTFALLDKAIPHPPVLLQSPVVFIDIEKIFFSVLQKEAIVAVNSHFQFVRRSCFLNDIDIQTAVRRFQI